jgi:hypothetical protein
MKAIVALCAMLPLSANATILYVDWAGEVSSSSDPDYSAGEQLSGSLLIDTSLAPADPAGSGFGRPLLSETVPSADFVTGFEHKSKFSNLEPFDYVQMSPMDMSYGVVDRQGSDFTNWSELGIRVQLPSLYHFERPYDIEQSFEATSTDGLKYGEFGASITEIFEGVRTEVIIALSRFSVTSTPGEFRNDYVCRPS